MLHVYSSRPVRRSVPGKHWADKSEAQLVWSGVTLFGGDIDECVRGEKKVS